MGPAADAAWNALTTSRTARGRQLPPIGLVVLATFGAMVLVVVAMNRWAAPQDEHSYWLAGARLAAGQPLYDPSAQPGTPYAYFYPPPLAQLIAPLTRVISSDAFSILWTALELGCLLWIARGRPLVALALVLFVPVAVELWYRNVHLVLAVLLVLALRRRPWLFAVAASIKATPGLGIVYLAARGRWRDAALASLVGLAILAVSVVLSPAAWSSFVQDVMRTAPSVGASLIPVPFAARAATGLILALIAGRLPERVGEPLLIVAIVVANPTLWATSLSMLIAILPIIEHRRTLANNRVTQNPDVPAGAGVAAR